VRPNKNQHEYWINECGVAKKAQSQHAGVACNPGVEMSHLAAHAIEKHF
jgi:hypothetical protein